MATYFTSDLHLGGKKMLNDRACFSSVEEMDLVLIQNWNSVVSNIDDVYILGDIGGGYTVNIKEYIEQLKGNKHLIVGNHDSEWIDMIIRFAKNSVI